MWLLAVRLCDSREVYGLWVTIWRSVDESDSCSLLDEVERALRLLSEHSSRDLRLVQKGYKRILVAPSVYGAGYLRSDYEMCVLDRELVVKAPRAAIAATLVHEATHARLKRRGHRYTEGKRSRLERLC